MAFVPISTNQTTQVAPNAADDIIILPGVSVVVAGDSAVDARTNSVTNVNLTVMGTVVSDILGIDFQTPADDSIPGNYEIYIAPSGSVIGASDFYVAIAMDGASNKFYNAGYVGGRFTSEGNNFRGANTGIMEDFDGANAVDISSIGGGSSFLNSGSISSGSVGVQMTSGSGLVSFTNSGTVQAVAAAVRGSTGVERVVNSGTLSGEGTNALELFDGADTVVNAGLIFGTVDLGAGADRYQALGAGVASLVSGGEGNDTLLGADDGDLLSGGTNADLVLGHGGDDTLTGEAGDDRILGGEGDDSINGGTENDTLNGGAGDDTIEGEAGNDILLGQAGVDFLTGAAGNDTLDGGAGDDSLYGGADADVLRGRDGVDYIDGGLGRDVTEGGQGADIFIFNTTADSTADANRDVILDFETGLDTINLVNVVPGAFVFRGTLGFTATGSAELRLQELADGSTIIHMDTDGNGTADMQIRTAGVTGLTAGDFEL